MVAYHAERETKIIGKDIDGDWAIIHSTCPECGKLFLTLVNGEATIVSRSPVRFEMRDTISIQTIHPKSSKRPPVPPQVPSEFSDDYQEACLVIDDSPKASAALSRRCLQHILNKMAEVDMGNLFKEIDTVVTNNLLPSYIAGSLDAIRNIGNFAAHPIKSKNTGEIVNVEPGEAEWSLDIIEMLFDFYFVQPEIVNKKRDDLNKLLTDAGKPPMK